MADATFTPPRAVLITGSRGLIGSELVPRLVARGHEVVRLVSQGSRHTPCAVAADGTRSVPTTLDGTRWIPWNPAAPLPAGTLDGIDAVVHLAGDNIAGGRWTAVKVRRIIASRLDPTRHLVDAIAALPRERRPKVFLCASAVGYYGDRGDEILTEDSPRGDAKFAFFPGLCRSWEEATRPATDAGVRTANLRIGVVLSPKGGALGKQLLPFKLGLGAVLGSGRQWVPWITVTDVARAIEHCLTTDAVRGPVNVVGPNPVTNREFTKTLGRVLRRPAFFWLPKWFLRAVFGPIADEALLASMRAVPKKLLDTGFAFEHADLATGLRAVLGR